MSPASREEIRDVVRNFIISEFLLGEDPSLLADDAKLISGGIMDSIAVVRLVSYLEEHFGFQLQSQDVTVSRFDTIERIVGTVQEKSNIAS
jgi:acyl carrier protein